MRIDPNVEEPLRRAFVAVVDHDADGVLPPLESLDDDQTGLAVGYAALVVGYVMNDVYGEDTNAEAAIVMTETLVPRVSEWTDIGAADDVSAFLLACSTGGGEFPDLDPDKSVAFAVTIAGYLLSWYRPEGMRWFEYLDQIWNDAESQPDPA